MGRPKKIQTGSQEGVQTTPTAPIPTILPKAKVKRNFDEVESLAIPKEILSKYGIEGEQVHYFWCKRDRLQIDKFVSWGYGFVESDSDTNTYKGIIDEASTGSTFVIRGDVILMYTDIENWKAKQMHDKEKANKAVSFLHTKNKQEANNTTSQVPFVEEMKSESLNSVLK